MPDTLTTRTSPGLQRREALRCHAALSERRSQVDGRLLHRLVGEMERAPVVAERLAPRPHSSSACTASSGFMCALRMNQRGS